MRNEIVDIDAAYGVIGEMVLSLHHSNAELSADSLISAVEHEMMSMGENRVACRLAVELMKGSE